MNINFQGIDRKDVRIVCHFNIPKSMEAFYQESGRAGRDQLPSRSILYYGIDDRKRMVGRDQNAGRDQCILFFLFDCFYLSAMTFDFLLVYVIDLKGMTMCKLGIKLHQII